VKEAARGRQEDRNKRERSGRSPHIKKLSFKEKESGAKKTSASGPAGRWKDLQALPAGKSRQEKVD
jgi:hypothetical protein